MYEDSAKLYDFCKAMESLSHENFQAFTEKFDFTGVDTHLDIGGSLGVLSRKSFEKYPRVNCHSLDLPKVTELAIRENQNSKISFLAGDMFSSDMPVVDGISLGLILHDWGLEDKKTIIKKSLRPSKTRRQAHRHRKRHRRRTQRKYLWTTHVTKHAH